MFSSCSHMFWKIPYTWYSTFGLRRVLKEDSLLDRYCHPTFSSTDERIQGKVCTKMCTMYSIMSLVMYLQFRNWVYVSNYCIYSLLQTFWELLLGQVLAISLIIAFGLLIIPLFLIPYCIPVKRLSGWLTK